MNVLIAEIVLASLYVAIATDLDIGYVDFENTCIGAYMNTISKILHNFTSGLLCSSIGQQNIFER